MNYCSKIFQNLNLTNQLSGRLQLNLLNFLKKPTQPSLKRQRRKRKIPLSIASIEEWRGGRQNLVQLFPRFDFRAENYSNVKNFPVCWGAEQETQQVNHRTRMNREQCWVWHYSVIVVSLAVINVMSFSLLLVLFAHCCDFKPQRRMRICARPFCFNSTRLWWFFPHCHILLLPPQLYILLSHGILSVKTMPSLLVRPRSLAGSERVRHVHGTTQRNGNFFRLLDLKLFQVFCTNLRWELLLTVLVHSHRHALLQPTSLALVPMSFVDYTATCSRLTSGNNETQKKKAKN